MMMWRASRPQTGPSGITLTEILISIMILAIGLVSLATLFPIGMLRLREAQRSSRTAILSESTAADVLGRGLLERTTFIDPTISSWYAVPYVPTSYDPWIQDTPGPFADWTGGGDSTAVGAYRGAGGMGAKDVNQFTVNGLAPLPGLGLPVAYDPLWWFQQGVQPYRGNGRGEARFAAAPAALGLNSASGLQRLTNIPAFAANGAGPAPYQANVILSAFVSPEDVLWQDAKNTSYFNFFNPTRGLAATRAQPVVSPSPVIPDLSTAALSDMDAVLAAGGSPGVPANYAAPTNDWRYTWMFVGQRADAFNDKIFTGNVVIFENRPFGFETLVNSATGVSVTQVAGERTLQAIFGYGTNVIGAGTLISGGTDVGYGIGSDNAVLLLWPAGMPDPEIRPGGWIADVTYERNEALARSNFLINPVGKAGSPPAQRCHWYQTRRASPPAPADALGFAGKRYSLVQTTQKLQAKTLLDASGAPVHDNAALVSPYIVGAIPKTFSLP